MCHKLPQFRKPARNIQCPREVLIIFTSSNDADGVDEKVFDGERVLIVSVEPEQNYSAASAYSVSGCFKLISNRIDDRIYCFLSGQARRKFIRVDNVQAQ